MRFGGDTTAFLVEGEQGGRILLDMGTGARTLAGRLRQAEVRRLLVLLSHFHLDHLLGLPSFPLLYSRGVAVEFAMPGRPGGHTARLLSRVLAQPFWPLQLDQVAARLRFHDLPKSSARALRFHGFAVRWAALHHPSGCWAYRLDESSTGASLVFATDVEWPAASESARTRWLAWARTPAPPHALFFDGQYTPEEYDVHRGWGHSRWTDALEVGRAIGARRVYLIHHAPDHDDRALAQIEQKVRAAWAAARLVRQGELLTISA